MLPDIDSLKRILVVRLDNIGDVIMLAPAVRAIKGAFPKARITLMASPAGSQAGNLLPWIDDQIVLRAIWQDVSGSQPVDLTSEYGLIDQIRLCEFDAAFIFTSFSQSPYPPGYVCMLAGIPIRVGQSKEFGGGILTHSYPSTDDSIHQADRNLYLLEKFGIPISGRELEIQVSPETQSHAAQILAEAGLKNDEPFVVVAPGASCSSRQYPLVRFAEVVKLLRLKTGLKFALIGSKGEEKYFEPILSSLVKMDGVYSLVGLTTVSELAGVIQRSALVIANNSSALHIADALKIPSVILYSGTELLSQWSPRSTRAAILHRSTVCSPCYRFNCPYHLECLEITPEEVVEAALTILAPVQEQPLVRIIEFQGQSFV